MLVKTARNILKCWRSIEMIKSGKGSNCGDAYATRIDQLISCNGQINWSSAKKYLVRK